MALDRGELDRLADETYKNRTIAGFVYCGRCGYNLHSLPYVHTCPECGNQYNARPLSMTGIFTPHDASLPISELAGMILCLVVGGGLIWVGVTNPGTWQLVVGVAIVILAIVLGYQSYGRMARFFNTLRIARQIEAED